MELNLQDVSQLLINTGNMLSLNDITKKPAQNPAEELTEAIHLTIKNYTSGNNADKKAEHLLVSRSNDDFATKMADHDINDLKIGLKVFLNNGNPDFFREAIEKAFDVLNVSNVHNVIIAFKKNQTESSDILDQVKNVWTTIEEYARSKKIQQIGLADIEEAAFRQLYDWASVKPSIIQINLATCCVVPPTLQAFCKDKDIQLLTHSDPSDILPNESVKTILGKPFVVNWVLRYLVHVKCRGVLTTKGYLISLSK